MAEKQEENAVSFAFDGSNVWIRNHFFGKNDTEKTEYKSLAIFRVYDGYEVRMDIGEDSKTIKLSHDEAVIVRNFLPEDRLSE